MEENINENINADVTEMTLFGLNGAEAEIWRAVEEAEGEITPEQEARLAAVIAARADKAEAYNGLRMKLEGYIDMVREEERRLAERRRRMERGVASLKRRLADAMEQAGVERIETPTLTIQRRLNPESVECDEAELLAPYEDEVNVRLHSGPLPDWLRVELKVSKTALKEWIREGHPVPQSCRIRRDTTVVFK